MPATNIMANLFASLQNAEMRNKKECMVIPASNLASEVLKVLQKKRYIGEFEFIDDGMGGKLRVQLLGRINKCGVISPRFPVRSLKLVDWEHRYLPAVGIGTLIVSTPQGVMSHTEAQERKIGGRLIGYVF
ncbi:MAG: 30S ribosomal protein S8 [Nitrososphaerota archaeon]|jgi:small subunit ribosomal protein S8|nr:30S ribosomal protein S8 [Nitrososphaerota archaeon]